MSITLFNFPDNRRKFFQTISFSAMILFGYFTIHFYQKLEEDKKKLNDVTIKMTSLLISETNINKFYKDQVKLWDSLNRKLDNINNIGEFKDLYFEINNHNEISRILENKQKRVILQNDSLITINLKKKELLLNDVDLHSKQFNTYLLITLFFYIVFWGISTLNSFSYCNSCGKTLNSLNPNGTNIDGSKNEAFCSKCYVNGNYTEPELTYEEVRKRSAVEFIETNKELINNISKNEKYKNKYIRKKEKFLKRMNKLRRWKRDDYE